MGAIDGSRCFAGWQNLDGSAIAAPLRLAIVLQNGNTCNILKPFQPRTAAKGSTAPPDLNTKLHEWYWRSGSPRGADLTAKQ
ncbi:hypothetical protein OSH11_20905 [Kaistia dalseonensis]|uniref:Uncharacterized protein n=1 Tax=Kaistia dalseonensis TaxID=410840 RepID=A0ABU0HBW8_9HYPH|nr:hypothetical protein [Kaistia dalseonensis]MCX5497174.1 hypothetical protein [Kaistia dalseonensis]MDQ0439805.1 hypothetical protein [Kaistia dalseonensis]